MVIGTGHLNQSREVQPAADPSQALEERSEWAAHQQSFLPESGEGGGICSSLTRNYSNCSLSGAGTVQDAWGVASSFQAARICQNWTLFRDIVHPTKASPRGRVNFEGNVFCCGLRVASMLFAVSMRPAKLYLIGSGRNMVIRHGFLQTASQEPATDSQTLLSWTSFPLFSKGPKPPEDPVAEERGSKWMREATAHAWHTVFAPKQQRYGA